MGETVAVLANESPKLERYMRKAEVLSIAGISNTTLYRMMDAGSFPRQYALGEKAVGWKESEVEAWCNSRQKVE